MVFTTQPEIIAPDFSYSVMPWIRIGPSQDLRLGVAAGIDERPYDIGGGEVTAAISTVELLLTDSMSVTSLKIVSARTPWAPSSVDGGSDTGMQILDWNATWTAAELAALTDGEATVVATINTTDGQSKTLSAWEFWLDTAGAITPTTYHVREDGDDVEGDGSEGDPFATIGRAVQEASGDTWDIIDLEDGIETDIEPYNDLNSAGYGWISLDCSEGTHTLTGSHGSSAGFGSHKKWRLGPGLIGTQFRPGIDNGNNGGFWWLDGIDWSNPTEDGTPFSNIGVHPSRYERWYATGLTIHSHQEFNTGPTMSRGVTQYNFRGDSFLKASRDKNMTAYCTRLYDVIQSGGTHSDIFQVQDTATLGDVGTDHYVQRLICNDGEPATMQLSNENNILNFWERSIVEDALVDNDGLLGNVGEVNSTTNNNLMRRMRNSLWRHCGWRLQNQRWGPLDWTHNQYQACYCPNINSDNSSGGSNGGQTELDASGTTFDDGVYVGLSGFTSMPGTNQQTGLSVIWTTTDDTLGHDQQNYVLTAESPGKGMVTGPLYSGRPEGETDPGPWNGTARLDFTLPILMEVQAPAGGQPGTGTGAAGVLDLGIQFM